MNRIKTEEKNCKRSQTGILVKVIVAWGLLGVSACSSGLKETGTGVDYQEPRMEHCREDSLNIYHILVPEDAASSQKLPLVIVLDAHGSGAFAVNTFLDAVIDFPCLVVGSDLIKNNFQGFEAAILQLVRDVELKYPVDPQQIILAGFSGGARMAYYFAVKYQVKGLLMCGAGPGQQMPSCPVYMIAGMGDFNFSEQYIRPDIASFTEVQRTSIFFHGVHAWPSSGQLADALLFLLRDLEHMDQVRRNRTRELLQSADSLVNAGEELMAWQALEKAAKIAVNKREKERAIDMARELLNSKEFRQIITALEHQLCAEQKMQEAYLQAMGTKDAGWWKNELSLLDEKLTISSGGFASDHYQRIKGFIGILFYSRINSLIQSDPGNPHLKTLLESYAYAEPENPDPYYFKALYARLNGDREACIKNRKRAQDLGLKDQDKIEKITF